MNLFMAGTTTLSELASALAAHAEESPIIAELKAGSEDAYAWLIEHYHQQVYNLVYRILNDPADAADTTQEVFIKVFRGIKRFNGASSLKTWLYRIAVHEASNQRRWWFRHKGRETSIEPEERSNGGQPTLPLKETLIDNGASPYECAKQHELLQRVECELREVPEPYRTTVVLRDLEDLSYEEVAEVTGTSLGTVKSRLIRGREALKKRLQPYLQESSPVGEAGNDGREAEVAS